MDFKTSLKDADPEVFGIINKEFERQKTGLELIPSESFTSLAVLNALGSVMNNKYAEGYPHKRYYGGNEFIDQSEELAINRCKELFGCEHANVQPYSGSPGNLEVYFALLNFGDKVLGMNLAHGGHLTHGHKVNFSGKGYNFVQYGVSRENLRIDMDEVRKVAIAEQPKMILSGATAYPREIDFKAFHEIAEEVGAYSFADVSHIAGLIAGGVHQSPFPFTDVVMTTTHKTLCGPRGAVIMCKEEDWLKEKYDPEGKKNLAKKIDAAVFPGMQGGPHEHQIAAKAVAFKYAMKPEFKEYAAQVVKNAKALASSLMEQGIKLCTDGTDNHLILADLTPTGVSGKEAETALDKAGITVNKNMIPFDTRSPFDPSGIRLGTPALTTRGMGESEMRQIGVWIKQIIDNHTDEALIKKVRSEVKEMALQFELYTNAH